MSRSRRKTSRKTSKSSVQRSSSWVRCCPPGPICCRRPYLDALSRLQDDVEPVPLADVQKTIEDDLNVRVSKAFLSFDPEPLACASLGQVHRATLRDGRTVAVKVQRPGIIEQALADLTVLDEIAAFIDQHTKVGRRYEFAPMIREFRRSLMEELDYEAEASHLRTLGRNLPGSRASSFLRRSTATSANAFWRWSTCEGRRSRR